MRIAIMGAGGIGAFYGACLARAGNDVTFIARGSHLAAMSKHGLRIDDFKAPGYVVKPINVTDDPGNIGPVDNILFCVKMYDTIEAAQLCKLMICDSTSILTLQNGVESVEMIDSVVGEGRTLGGAAYVSATIKEPGVIKRNNQLTKIELGEPKSIITPRAKVLADTLKQSGVDAVVHKDVRSMLWTKFVLMTSNSSLSSIARADTGVVRSDPIMREVYQNAMCEAIAVGKAMGVKLGDDIVDRYMNLLDESAPVLASLVVDLERGRRLEVEWLSGALHRLGAQLGVPTPIHSTVYAALRPHVNGRA